EHLALYILYLEKANERTYILVVAFGGKREHCGRAFRPVDLLPGDFEAAIDSEHNRGFQRFVSKLVRCFSFEHVEYQRKTRPIRERSNRSEGSHDQAFVVTGGHCAPKGRSNAAKGEREKRIRLNLNAVGVGDGQKRGVELGAFVRELDGAPQSRKPFPGGA